MTLEGRKKKDELKIGIRSNLSDAGATKQEKRKLCWSCKRPSTINPYGFQLELIISTVNSFGDVTFPNTMDSQVHTISRARKTLYIWFYLQFRVLLLWTLFM